MYISAETYETLPVARVIKVAHSPRDIQKALDSMLIDKEEHATKLQELFVEGRINVHNAVHGAVRSDTLDMLFGHPLLTHPLHETSLGGGQPEHYYHMSYTQDLCTPVSDILAGLDLQNDDDFRVAYGLVDTYIDTQLLLCSYNIYDPHYKIADNFGVSIPAPFDDPLDNFRMLDIGEFGVDKERLVASIERKEWRDIVNRSEYTKLPYPLQEYFDEALSKRFTTDAVHATWGTGRYNNSHLPLHVLEARMLDQALPRGLPLAIWNLTEHDLQSNICQE